MHPSEDVAAKHAVEEFDDIPEPTVLEYEAPEPLPAWDTLAAGPQVGGPDFIPEFGSERYETVSPPMPIWAIGVIMVAALSLGGMLAYLWLGDAPAESLAGGTRDAVQGRGAEAAASDPETTPPADPVTKEPSEAPRPASMGTLRINAPAGATVFIDGEARGRGTFEGTVSIGQHFVRVLKPGFTPWEDDVTVLSTDNRPLDIDLTRVSGASSSSRPSTSPSKPEESNTAAKANTSNAGSKPVSAATPHEPEAPVSPPAAPQKPSKTTPTDPSKDDGVFMEPSKGKDDGIFLPVGKQK
jgi:hypothetical protein